MTPRLRTGLVFAVALLVFIAPLKFSLPVILYFLDTPLTSWLEWLLCGWPTVVFYVLLAPVAVLGLGVGKWDLPLKRLAWLPGVFLAVQVLSSLGSVKPPVSRFALWYLISLGAGYLLGARLIRTERDRRWISWAWVLAALLIAWGGLGQATGGLKQTREYLLLYRPDVAQTCPDYWAKVQSDRIFGTFANPNAFGGYIASAVFMVGAWCALALGSRPPTRPSERSGPGARRMANAVPALDWSRVATLVLGGFVTLILLYCLWKTQSKGAYAVLFLTLMVLAVLVAPHPRKAWIAIALIGLIAVGGFAAGYGHAAIRKGRQTFGARVGYWRAALEIGSDHPMLGTGPGTFGKMYSQYKRPLDEDTRLAHNSLLQMWSDSGILGLISFVLWQPGALVLWLRRWRRVPPRERLVPTLWWCACLAYTLHSLVDFDLYLIGNSWPILLMTGYLATAKPGNENHPAD